MGADRAASAAGHAQPEVSGPPATGRPQGSGGILFVLYTGIRWEFLPQELGFGSGMTCWRRLRDWNEAGVWQRLHELLLAELQRRGICWTSPAPRSTPPPAGA